MAAAVAVAALAGVVEAAVVRHSKWEPRGPADQPPACQKDDPTGMAVYLADPSPRQPRMWRGLERGGSWQEQGQRVLVQQQSRGQGQGHLLGRPRAAEVA